MRPTFSRNAPLGPRSSCGWDTRVFRRRNATSEKQDLEHAPTIVSAWARPPVPLQVEEETIHRGYGTIRRNEASVSTHVASDVVWFPKSSPTRGTSRNCGALIMQRSRNSLERSVYGKNCEAGIIPAPSRKRATEYAKPKPPTANAGTPSHPL